MAGSRFIQQYYSWGSYVFLDSITCVIACVVNFQVHRLGVVGPPPAELRPIAMLMCSSLSGAVIALRPLFCPQRGSLSHPVDVIMEEAVQNPLVHSPPAGSGDGVCRMIRVRFCYLRISSC